MWITEYCQFNTGGGGGGGGGGKKPCYTLSLTTLSGTANIMLAVLLRGEAGEGEQEALLHILSPLNCGLLMATANIMLKVALPGTERGENQALRPIIL